MLVTQHLCNRLYICHRHIKLRGKGDIQWILQFIQKQLDEKSRIYAPDMKGTIFFSRFLIILSVNLIFVNEPRAESVHNARGQFILEEKGLFF